MQDVYIVDGSRTPFIKFKGKANPLSSTELSLSCAKPLLLRQNFSKNLIEEVVVGCVAPAANEANIARIIALRLGLGEDTLGFTVQRNCASGLQAIDSTFKDIATGRHECALVGGVEAMSHAPLIYKASMTNWLADLKLKKGFLNKCKHLGKLRANMLIPEVALKKALNDPVVNLSMGQTAEELAYRFNLSQDEINKYAVESNLRASNGVIHKNQIEPLYDWLGNELLTDDGIRADTTLTKLNNLRPVFERPEGLITAGNSSQISDGACFVILASGNFVKKHKLKVLAKVSACNWQALDPTVMGLGPANAIARLLLQEKLNLEDIAFWEINEAFAAQVLACVKALNDDKYCAEHFDSSSFGKIPSDKLNIEGGAIALGHPVGASGTRIVLHLANILKQNNGKRGIASLCIGGGQGGAMLIENTSGAA